MSPTSAIPDFYYFCFAVYEPFLTVTGFIGALYDPLTTHNSQAPWPAHTSAPENLPKATLVTIIQLAHVCALLGVVNFFVLTAARKYLHIMPAIQEKIVRALLIPLMIGDVLHLYVTLWALGDERWDLSTWSPMLWTTVILGLTLMLPRMAWHLGIGRYVDRRDGSFSKMTDAKGIQEKK